MLEIQEVTKKYGKKIALSKVNLQLTEGIYGLLGPNGAGKSTLMNIITGNIEADSGKVLWNGQLLKTLGAEYRRILGYAPQQQGLYEGFTGRRFLSYLGVLKEIPKKDLAQEIERTASSVNLTEKLDYPIGTYSGGMKQRLLIAQAMMGNPQLIILDEPTAGLDPKERVRIREKIKEISKGKIILIATHVVSDVQSIAKEIIFLKGSEIVTTDSVEALKFHYEVGNLEEVYMEIFGEEAENHDEADTL